MDEIHKYGELTDDQVREIRQLRAKGATLKDLEKRFHLTNSVLSRISRGLSYKDVPPQGLEVLEHEANFRNRDYVGLWRMVRGAIYTHSTRTAIERLCANQGHPQFLEYCIHRKLIKEI